MFRIQSIEAETTVVGISERKEGRYFIVMSTSRDTRDELPFSVWRW